MGGKFGEVTLFEHLVKESLVKKVWQINRSDNRLLIVSTNFDGFSLAKHGPNSPNFPLYGTTHFTDATTCIHVVPAYVHIACTYLFVEHYY